MIWRRREADSYATQSATVSFCVLLWISSYSSVQACEAIALDHVADHLHHVLTRTIVGLCLQSDLHFVSDYTFCALFRSIDGHTLTAMVLAKVFNPHGNGDATYSDREGELRWLRNSWHSLRTTMGSGWAHAGHPLTLLLLWTCSQRLEHCSRVTKSRLRDRDPSCAEGKAEGCGRWLVGYGE